MKQWFIHKFLLGQLRKAAEGGYGRRVKALYWWLVGKKTYTGFFLALVAYAFSEAHTRGLCADCGSWAVWITGTLSVFLVQIGIADAAMRAEKPDIPVPWNGALSKARSIFLAHFRLDPATAGRKARELILQVQEKGWTSDETKVVLDAEKGGVKAVRVPRG